MPATVECDVLPSVDVDRSGIEHLNPGQQGELTMSLLHVSVRSWFYAEFVEYGYCLYSWCVV